MRCLLLMLGWLPLAAAAVNTDLEVRVLAKDAKFVGSAMGGVAITVRDFATGKVLAAGETRGGTGDTDRIMREPWQRGRALFTEGAASFRASLDLAAPVLVEVIAAGPLGFPQARQSISLTHWLLPGKHVVGGDALRLELPGFVVTARAEPADLRLTEQSSVELGARVTMMCGCPLTPGGLWDSDGYEIRAWLYRDGQQVGELPLRYAGEPNEFTARWQPDAPGYYEVLTYAFDPANGNTGVDRVGVRVQP